jgi:tripartite-type tricarboxylate transporter receptor subunit TctC
MKLPRRNFLQLAAGAAALPAVSRIATAQTYPSRPVRWITGLAAGGTGDILARLMGQWLSERFGQPFIIENRPGAGDTLAAEQVDKADNYIDAAQRRAWLKWAGIPPEFVKKWDAQHKRKLANAAT